MLQTPSLVQPVGAAVSHHQLTDACGHDPSFICRQVVQATGSNELARVAEFVVDVLIVPLLIILGAFVLSRVARRVAKRTVRGVAQHDHGRFHAPAALRDTGELGDARSGQRAEALAAAFAGLASFVVWVVAVLFILRGLGVRLGPLLAGAGLLGVALGFGAQTLVRDLLAGVFILVEDQFGVGDYVKLPQAEGEVEAVTLRATRIRAVDGTVWHVGNGELPAVGNMSQHWSRAVLDLKVAYTADVNRAREVMKHEADELWQSDSAVIEEPEVLGVQRMDTTGVVIRLVVKTRPREQWRVSRELRERIKARFEREGIEFPSATPVGVGDGTT